MLMSHLDAAFSYNFKNDCGVIFVGVSIRIPCVAKLNDITWTNALCLPMNASTPYVSASVPYSSVKIGQVSQPPTLPIAYFFTDVLFGKGDNFFCSGAWFAYLSDDRSGCLRLLADNATIC